MLVPITRASTPLTTLRGATNTHTSYSCGETKGSCYSTSVIANQSLAWLAELHGIDTAYCLQLLPLHYRSLPIDDGGR